MSIEDESEYTLNVRVGGKLWKKCRLVTKYPVTIQWQCWKASSVEHPRTLFVVCVRHRSDCRLIGLNATKP